MEADLGKKRRGAGEFWLLAFFLGVGGGKGREESGFAGRACVFEKDLQHRPCWGKEHDVFGGWQFKLFALPLLFRQLLWILGP